MFLITESQKKQLQSTDGFCNQINIAWENPRQICILAEQMARLPIVAFLQRTGQSSLLEMDQKTSETFNHFSQTFHTLQERFKTFQQSPETAMTLFNTDKTFYNLFSYLTPQERRQCSSVCHSWNQKFQEFSKTEICIEMRLEDMKKGLKFLDDLLQMQLGNFSQIQKASESIPFIEEETPSNLSELHALEVKTKEAYVSILKNWDAETLKSLEECASKENAPEFVKSLIRLVKLSIQAENFPSLEIAFSFIDEGFLDQALNLSVSRDQTLDLTVTPIPEEGLQVFVKVAERLVEMGDVGKALEIGQEAKVLYGKKRREANESDILQMIACKLADRGEFDQAIEIARIIPSRNIQFKTIGDIAIQLAKLGNFSKAMELLAVHSVCQCDASFVEIEIATLLTEYAVKHDNLNEVIQIVKENILFIKNNKEIDRSTKIYHPQNIIKAIAMQLIENHQKMDAAEHLVKSCVEDTEVAHTFQRIITNLIVYSKKSIEAMHFAKKLDLDPARKIEILKSIFLQFACPTWENPNGMEIILETFPEILDPSLCESLENTLSTKMKEQLPYAEKTSSRIAFVTMLARLSLFLPKTSLLRATVLDLKTAILEKGALDLSKKGKFIKAIEAARLMHDDLAQYETLEKISAEIHSAALQCIEEDRFDKGIELAKLNRELGNLSTFEAITLKFAGEWRFDKVIEVFSHSLPTWEW